jgi:protein-disulfide isomerase
MITLRRTTVPLLAALLAFCSSAFAAADGSRVPLPAGVDLAIVVFADLQCPDCARAHPELLKVAAETGVPLLIHDFPIVRHLWAFPAAIMARYFTAQSEQLGTEFRSYIFENQRAITPENLREWGEKFAQLHGVQLPPELDPEGKLQAQVQADFNLGREIGLEYVPLMFVNYRAGSAIMATEVTTPQEIPRVVARFRQ